jgi:hypothetical protein
LDPNNWTDWEDTTTEGIKEKINYIVGSPSLEMYVDSYNAYLDSHSGLYMNESTTTLAKKLACEYNTNGYRIGFANVAASSWDNTGYYQNSNSLISSSVEKGMYNPGSSEYYWLASTSDVADYGIMSLYGKESRIGCFDFDAGGAFCPLVSLKSGAKLEIVDE